MLKLMIMPENYEQERNMLRATKDSTGSVLIRRTFVAEVKAEEGDDRALNFTISTAAIDRYGDTVAVDGWKLDNFKKNPVVLWMHNNLQRPVARAMDIRIEGGKLKSRAVFRAEGVEPFSDGVLWDLKNGFLATTSVGFIPLKYSFVDDPSRRFGIDFEEQELLEFSVVTVPANPEALIEGRNIETPPELAPPEMSLALAQARMRLLKARAA